MKNKNILLTGGTGFLGSHILEKLLSEGFNIILLKRSFSNTKNIDGIIDKIKSYDIDLIDNIENIFINENINIILHTATTYGRGDGEFNKIIESNLLLPIKLLELGIKYKIKCFINTDTFWNEKIELPIGLSYYAYTKKDFIKYSKKLIENSNIKLINIKLEHLYGPKDNNKKFIPYIITGFLNNIKNIDLTKGEQRKDFIYINDAVNAYIHILKNIDLINIGFEEFDLGTGISLSIKELILEINSIIKADTLLNFGAIPYRKGEEMESKANIKKLYDFGWKQEYSLDLGLKKTIKYFRSKNK